MDFVNDKLNAHAYATMPQTVRLLPLTELTGCLRPVEIITTA